ncbi:DUF2922 domain-containing protein [Acetoanaerobium noterae]|uniref:DUF2922 domain-containing protein n=1 Tax=Acetoanaerobium noterae TaxID=745369 RepID=UPI0032218EA7
MNEKKSVLMRFKKVDGKGFTISIQDPKDSITESEIKEVMEAIVAKKAVIPGGIDIHEAVDAKIVNTTVERFDLVI